MSADLVTLPSAFHRKISSERLISEFLGVARQIDAREMPSRPIKRKGRRINKCFILLDVPLFCNAELRNGRERMGRECFGLEGILTYVLGVAYRR